MDQLSMAMKVLEEERHLVRERQELLNMETAQLSTQKEHYTMMQAQLDEITKEKNHLESKISQTKEESARLQSCIRKFNEDMSVIRKEIDNLQKKEKLQQSMLQSSQKTFEVTEMSLKESTKHLDILRKGDILKESIYQNSSPPINQMDSVQKIENEKCITNASLSTISHKSPTKGHTASLSDFDTAFHLSKPEPKVEDDSKYCDKGFPFDQMAFSKDTIEVPQIERNKSVKSTKSEVPASVSSTSIMDQKTRPSSAPIPTDAFFSVFDSQSNSTSPMKSDDNHNSRNEISRSISPGMDAFTSRFPEVPVSNADPFLQAIVQHKHSPTEVKSSDESSINASPSKVSPAVDDPFISIVTSKPTTSQPKPALDKHLGDSFNGFDSEFSKGAAVARKANTEHLFDAFNDLNSPNFNQENFDFGDFDKEFKKFEKTIASDSSKQRQSGSTAFDDVFGYNSEVMASNVQRSSTNFDDVFGTPESKDLSSKPVNFDEVFGSSTSGGSQKNQAPIGDIDEVGKNDDIIVKQLVDMGFNREKAIKALEQFNYNLENASLYLAESSREIRREH
jgi:hypothetical protein